MKMYILVKDTVPLGHAVNGVAHASLKCYLQFQMDIRMINWLKDSFKKVTCSVTPEEFENVKKYFDYVVVTESALGGMETAIAFCPRRDWPVPFRNFKLFGV